MTSLDLADGSVVGAVAFYSLVHLSDRDPGHALHEIARVLLAGAPVLVAVHRGSQTVHLDELWGIEVRLDFRFFRQCTARRSSRDRRRTHAPCLH